jgi:hypothetical protein
MDCHFDKRQLTEFTWGRSPHGTSIDTPPRTNASLFSLPAQVRRSVPLLPTSSRKEFLEYPDPQWLSAPCRDGNLRCTTQAIDSFYWSSEQIKEHHAE